MARTRCAAAAHSRRALMAGRAQVVDPDTGGEKLDDIRTSFGTFLAPGETDVIRRIEERVAQWSQVPLQNQEQLQILRCVARAGAWRNDRSG